MGRCPLEPLANRLVFVSCDLFGRPQAASSHHDQQGLRHLGSRGLQAIHRCSLRFPKIRLAIAAVITLPSSMAPIAHHMGLSTARIWTWGQGGLLLPLLLVL